MITFRGSVYMTFYILSPLMKFNFCQNTRNEKKPTFHLGVFHLSSYERLNRHQFFKKFCFTQNENSYKHPRILEGPITVSYWDGMGCVIIQTRDRAFQTLGQAFSFLLNLQRLAECFKSLTECFKSLDEGFKGSGACFEANARPCLLINRHINNF